MLGRELRPKVHFHQQLLREHTEILNEARLSALALSIFLAGVRLSNPIAVPRTFSPLRLLVLDDALMGLDQRNRFPLMTILEKEFPDHQILLFTHDESWYHYERIRVNQKFWRTLELRRGLAPSGTFAVPTLKDGDDVLKARDFLTAGDVPSAANHARKALEGELKRICERKGIEVPYKSDPNSLTSEPLVNALDKWRKGRNPPPVDDAFMRELRAIRSIIMNPLSHDGPSSMGSVEVQRAIKIVDDLRNKIPLK